MSGLDDNLTPENYFKNIIIDAEKQFRQITAWSEQQKEDFSKLLQNLKIEGNTTKETGDKLEKVVEFIIKNSFFYDIYKNIRTETNEIDEVIVLSNQGKIALHQLGLPKSILAIDEDLFLGECKNYSTKLNVTYVGKFYSLMSITGVTFGIIFTRLGLTGSSEGFKDAYGLTKILRMMEQVKNPNKDFNIITFTNDDYERLLKGETFFDIIKAKKLELRLAANYEQFVADNRHEAENEIKRIISEIL